MKNPFKEILTKKEVSFNLKNKILDDIHMIKLTYEINDLFLTKFPSTISDYYIREQI